MGELVYIHELDGARIREAQERSHGIWGEGRSLESRLAKLENLLALGTVLKVAGLVRDGRLVASLKHMRLAFRTSLGILPTIGIGAVFTPHEERRRGYARFLIEKTIAAAAREGYGASLLYSDIGAGYYEKLGYRALPSERMRISTGAIPRAGTLRTRALGASEDGRLLEWRERYAEAGVYGTSPDREIWKFLSTRNLIEAPLALAGADGEEVGYVAVTSAKDYLWIEEVRVPGSALAAAWATLADLAESRGFREIKGWLARAHAPAQAEWAALETNIPMLKLFPGRFAPLEPEIPKFRVGAPDYF